MPDIRYVCLSDLHFGAENSLLSSLVDNQVVVDATRASPVLDGLVAIMKTLIAGNEDQSRKPTLILNGDVLELALASDNVALMVFELFLDRCFPPDGEPLFDPTILYQPGNHDHHLWETSRERQYSDFIGTVAADAPLPIPWHTTNLFYLDDPRPVQAQLLDSVAQRQPHRKDVNFRISYPNMGIRSRDGQTAVVFHHGHFAESIYHLMTTLKDAIFPDRPEPTLLADVEAENFAWIDFFWSTLGRSGDVGDDVGLIYDMLQSNQAIDRVAANLAAAIVKRLPPKGLIGHFGWLIRLVLNRLVKTVASDVAASERRTPTVALSDKTRAGLLAYLSGPLARQLAAESADATIPHQVKFVFGHTHKPFVDTSPIPELGGPVRIFNSGGWVVDTLAVEPLHGANMVLIDENLEVACIRMYNQANQASAYRVRMDDGLRAEQGPFYQRLSGLVQPDEGVFKTFSLAVAALVAEREQALNTIIANAGQPRKAMRVSPNGTQP
jgi:hypothetical protein